MELSINCGHTVMGPGYGARSGSFKESQITRAVGNELIRLLKAKGHTVHNSTVNYAWSQNAYLKRVVEMANGKDIDLFISLHCNASTSHTASGVEVLFIWYATRHLTNGTMNRCYMETYSSPISVRMRILLD